MNRQVRPVLVTIGVLVALGPVAFMVLASLSPGTSFSVALSGRTLHAYTSILGTSTVAASLVLTTLVSLSSAILTVVLALPAAYSFARVRFRGSEILANSLLSAWLLPQIFIALAFFTIATDYGLYGNPAFMIFFGVLQAVPLSVWVLRSFVAQIPRELDEAALLDGAALPRFFIRVLLPTTAPSIAATAGYAFLMTWQMYLYPLVYLAPGNTQMASVGVSNFVGQWSTNYPQMMAYSVLITIPIIVVFLVIQRYIVSGLTSGAVNG